MKFGAISVLYFLHKRKTHARTYNIVIQKGPDLVAQAFPCLTEEPEVLGSVHGPVTFKKECSRNLFYGPFLSSTDSRRVVVSYWQKMATY